MKASTRLLGTIFFLLAATAHADLPVIKSSLQEVNVIIGDQTSTWSLSAQANPDVQPVGILNGKPVKVTFATDLDSISFQVEPGRQYDFIIEKDGQSFPTRIVGFTTGLKRFVSGNPQDVAAGRQHGPILDLEGGGNGNLAKGAMQRTVDGVRGCADCGAKIDVVVLGMYFPNDLDDQYNKATANFYFRSVSALNGIDSTEVILLSGREDAQKPEVAKAVANAEVIFFGGGIQCDYVNNIKGTAVARAVESVYTRGGAVGGTSAGQAIQGQIVFDGCQIKKTLVSSELALADPYDSNISFTDNFFHWRYMENTLTDQHVVKRNRIGRTFAFLARQIQDGKTRTARAIAVDESASVVVDRNGMAHAYGGDAYFILADHKPEVCESGKPLTYSNYKVWKRSPGDAAFNLKHPPKSGGYTVSVYEGKLSRNPY